jgi:hypothetical protein
MDMTTDSRHFQPLQSSASEGAQCDPYGRWLGDDGGALLPLYQGVMIRQFDYAAATYVSGAGDRAKWAHPDWSEKRIHPQFLVDQAVYNHWPKRVDAPKIGFRDFTNPTNTRTLIASVLGSFPCGNKVPTLQVRGGHAGATYVCCAVLNSFVLDYVLRLKFGVSAGAGSLNPFILNELPLPRPNAIAHGTAAGVARHVAALNAAGCVFAPDWLRLRAEYTELGNTHWQQLWAIDDAERLRRRCILDAIVAELYGLEYDDFAYIVRIDRDDLTGFWRVDKDLPDEYRHTTLSLRAFRDLKEMGLEAFCAHGWQLPPEAKTFRDARQTYTWTPTEDWSDCEQHARNIIGDGSEWKAFEVELEGIRRGETGASPDGTRLPNGDTRQASLF